ncbi:prepilin-type N-terminal cleavage/methylation domain-containing protein [Kribbella pittospori]|uniref:Prepilin-type N-terminal cleavage/methylation domain-containing protein n=1 Tax=Kribbella pittospori TaxID=722689 RepID=A0A4R0KM60_9ACTN|nr:prepilin-type N-terminal cleavage/methylation domain-containing protein [Kribbella pittospori]TCC60344.1 prepilin-type N-terminal cleavage/methylation domain-containing protein [Kribbella pittospori]
MLDRIREARRNESGFTLIELLMVIVILGVLAGIVVFAVNGITDRGALSACKAEVKTIAVAEEANYAQKGTYTDLAGLVTNGFLRPGTPKYVTGASTTDGSLTLTAPPAGCTAG